MRKLMDIVKKHNERRSAFKIFCAAAAIVLALTFSGAAYAAVRYKNIEKAAGFRFKNFVYDWKKLELDVVNISCYNRLFEGTMIFLDRRGKRLASASFLPKRIAGRKSERHTAYFVDGSGEAAQRATSIIWDFGTR